MNAIEITNLGYTYEGGKVALSGINLTIKKGEYVCLLGRNGSGKSTLARLINGLLTATEGEIKVFGMDASKKENLFEIRKRAGMVFQNPDNQMVASIVEDDLAFGPENIGIPPVEIGERINYALGAVGMEEFRHSTPTKLSGGQKQRIAIAGVLALKPEILILDESTAMLDPRGRAEVMDVIRKLNKDDGITVINITHYMEEAVDCDRLVVLSDGVAVLDGKPKEVFAHTQKISECGLEVPKVAYIAQKLRENGLPIGEVYEWEELKQSLCELLRKG